MKNSEPNPNGNGHLKYLKDLTDVYDKFEASVPLIKNGEEHLSLPHFNGNKSLPIHRWYTYKEGFSSGLLSWVCEITGLKLNSLNSILDPFVGVATSLLSAQLQYRGTGNLKLVGVERNPFTAFVAQTKLRWRDFNVDRIRDTIPRLVGRLSQGTNKTFDVPELTTLNNHRVFDPFVMQDLLFARETIKEELVGKAESAFFKLGWAAIIESCSNVRKDGRALRFVNKDSREPVRIQLAEKWYQMLSDIIKMRRDNSQGALTTTNIYEGDGRTLESLNGDTNFDLILYSPPYLNNLDYSEVYKLELWLSEAITNYQDFRSLRSTTFRSHPSYRFAETDLIDELYANTWPRRLRDSLLAALPENQYLEERRRTIRGYMDDIFIALKAQFQRIREGGFVVCVVGNSIHGTSEHPIPIPTDLLITSLAKEVGFNVVKVQATRHTNRRQLLDTGARESAIVLRRPKRRGI